MHLTIEQLNQACAAQASTLLEGLYEHSPWIAEQALAHRPFASLAHLKHCMVEVLASVDKDKQIALIRAHPELAGKAMVSNELTTESTNEQSKAGLTHCTPEEFAHIKALNAKYNERFGWPFILAVRGPRGIGLSRQEIISTLERRVRGHADFELAECLRNIHRIVEIRLNDKFGVEPTLGNEVWDWQESLAQFSDPGFKDDGQLTVTYLTAAHQACMHQIKQRFKECGFDEVYVDPVGNVVGRYLGTQRDAKTLMTGSHFDTVRNGGKYDGRLGIFVPMMCVRELRNQGKRLPFGIEVIAFSEEEGQRYKATFLGSGALLGQFNPEWLEQTDADGITMKQAMILAGLDVNGIPSIKRNPSAYLGFVEVHIEQGPILNERNLPLGIVTSINGSMRFTGKAIGMASHAGTTPMATRKDASTAVAEIALYMEQRAAKDTDSVATMGMLQVPNGSINVVPGQCNFSLDLRAPTDKQRDELVVDVLTALDVIAVRRGIQIEVEETMRASAAPSASDLQARWEAAVSELGIPLFKMTSGAGHDAMKLHEIMPQAMLFVRGQNSGISHNPLESTTSDDMQLCIEAFQALLTGLARDFAN